MATDIDKKLEANTELLRTAEDHYAEIFAIGQDFKTLQDTLKLILMLREQNKKLWLQKAIMEPTVQIKD